MTGLEDDDSKKEPFGGDWLAFLSPVSPYDKGEKGHKGVSGGTVGEATWMIGLQMGL